VGKKRRTMIVTYRGWEKRGLKGKLLGERGGEATKEKAEGKTQPKTQKKKHSGRKLRGVN